jgi:hypothetical protein
MLTKKDRILLASQNALRRLLAVLPDHELIYARNFIDPEATLKAHGFDLIMTGSRFDESRMFDLLATSKPTPSIPGYL